MRTMQVHMAVVKWGEYEAASFRRLLRAGLRLGRQQVKQAVLM